MPLPGPTWATSTLPPRPSASGHWQLTSYSATATGGPHSPGSSANKNPARQNEKAWKQQSPTTLPPARSVPRSAPRLKSRQATLPISHTFDQALSAAFVVAHLCRGCGRRALGPDRHRQHHTDLLVLSHSELKSPAQRKEGDVLCR